MLMIMTLAQDSAKIWHGLKSVIRSCVDEKH